jgi:hypothetical protein
MFGAALAALGLPSLAKAKPEEFPPPVLQDDIVHPNDILSVQWFKEQNIGPHSEVVITIKGYIRKSMAVSWKDEAKLIYKHFPVQKGFRRSCWHWSKGLGCSQHYLYFEITDMEVV